MFLQEQLILLELNLPPAEKNIMNVLAIKAFPDTKTAIISRRQLADYTGLSEHSIKRVLPAIEQKGLIEITRFNRKGQAMEILVKIDKIIAGFDRAADGVHGEPQNDLGVHGDDLGVHGDDLGVHGDRKGVHGEPPIINNIYNKNNTRAGRAIERSRRTAPKGAGASCEAKTGYFYDKAINQGVMEAWEKALQDSKGVLHWLSGAFIGNIENGKSTIQVKDAFTASSIRNEFRRPLENSLSHALGETIKLDIVERKVIH